MPDSDRRRKMISLRLSEVEYRLLKTRYKAYGARNVSDLARLALQQIMNEFTGSQDGMAGKLFELDNRIQWLESQISLILDREKAVSRTEART